MAKLNKAFDSDQHEDMNSFDPIPQGEYIVQVKDSDYCENSKKNGYFAKYCFEVLKGAIKGRLIWVNLNLENPNPVAVEIAEKEHATLCRACGKTKIQDTKELHGIPFLMGVRIKPAKGDYPPQNAPKSYKALPSGASKAKEKAGNGDGKKKKAGVPWSK